jgi:hypothetical protein
MLFYIIQPSIYISTLVCSLIHVMHENLIWLIPERMSRRNVLWHGTPNWQPHRLWRCPRYRHHQGKTRLRPWPHDAARANGEDDHFVLFLSNRPCTSILYINHRRYCQRIRMRPKTPCCIYHQRNMTNSKQINISTTIATSHSLIINSQRRGCSKSFLN